MYLSRMGLVAAFKATKIFFITGLHFSFMLDIIYMVLLTQPIGAVNTAKNT